MTQTEQAPPALAVTVSTVVPASPDLVYAMLSDVTAIGARSPETYAAQWLDGAGEEGSRFKGRNRIGFLRWSTVATVTEAAAGRAFAFETSAPSRTSWRYDLEAVDGGTRVTESMCKQEQQPLPIRLMQRAAGVSDREAHLRAGMTTTLARLAAAAAKA